MKAYGKKRQHICECKLCGRQIPNKKTARQSFKKRIIEAIKNLNGKKARNLDSV